VRDDLRCDCHVCEVERHLGFFPAAETPTSCEEKHMAEARRISRVHRSLSRPLTILGPERKLFFFAMCLGAATFNLLNSFIGGLLMFLLLYFMAPLGHTD
jgi:type IV secretory pathway TrbD component